MRIATRLNLFPSKFHSGFFSAIYLSPYNVCLFILSLSLICCMPQGFWEDFEEVLDVQVIRRKNGQAKASAVIPNMADPPESWADFSVDQVAEAVHDEPPCFHQNAIM